MSNDISVSPTQAVHGTSPQPSATPAGNGAASQSTGPASPPPGPASSWPNPSLRLDPGLGLVVLEFHDDGGAVTRSIPSSSQLEAYRHWLDDRQGPNPLAQTASL